MERTSRHAHPRLARFPLALAPLPIFLLLVIALVLLGSVAARTHRREACRQERPTHHYRRWWAAGWRRTRGAQTREHQSRSTFEDPAKIAASPRRPPSNFGMRYVSIPMTAPADLNSNAIAALRAATRHQKPLCTVVGTAHCGVARRPRHRRQKGVAIGRDVGLRRWEAATAEQLKPVAPPQEAEPGKRGPRRRATTRPKGRARPRSHAK